VEVSVIRGGIPGRNGGELQVSFCHCSCYCYLPHSTTSRRYQPCRCTCTSRIIRNPLLPQFTVLLTSTSRIEYRNPLLHGVHCYCYLPHSPLLTLQIGHMYCYSSTNSTATVSHWSLLLRYLPHSPLPTLLRSTTYIASHLRNYTRISSPQLTSPSTT